MRKAKVERKTIEVDITVKLNVDEEGKAETGIKFLDHLLVTLTKHSLFDLTVKAKGELKHHVCEDVALTLGEALQKALAEKKGIRRFGSAHVPMDDSLARAAVNLGGRIYSSLDLKLSQPQIEDLKTEDIKHFFNSLAQTSKSNLHLAVLHGTNDHHKIEVAVKALTLALREAVMLESRTKSQIPSTKVCCNLPQVSVVSNGAGNLRSVKLPDSVKIPQMGWNIIEIVRPYPLLEGIRNSPYVYFVNAYVPQPSEQEVIVATTEYGVKFPSVVAKRNLFATQFHPEKSGKTGLVILRNFVKIIKR